MAGRMTFERNERVRILTLEGHISQEEYVVEIERADRKGHIALYEVGTDRKVKVNQRRVLQNCNDGDAFVVEVGDKHRAVCPKCSYVAEVTPSDDSITCPDHGETQLQWRKGERPMADAAATTEKQETEAPTASPEVKAKPTPAKKDKPTREPIVIDFENLKKNPDFELWTKKSVQFDHEKIDVQAHVLLFTGDNPRKLCFNTYDGTLGKKGRPLPTNEFVKDEEVDGKKSWYAVKDVEKAKAKLTKDGYELQQ